MKVINKDKQMTDVWQFPAIGRWEKSCSKHPTQNPLALLTRILLASTDEHDWILDPFAGSSTTGIAVNLCGRRFLGTEQDLDFSNLSRHRRKELDNKNLITAYRKKIRDINFMHTFDTAEEPVAYYGIDLPL